MLGRRTRGCLRMSRCCEAFGDIFNSRVSVFQSQHQKLPSSSSPRLMKSSQFYFSTQSDKSITPSPNNPTTAPVLVTRKRNTSIIRVDPSDYEDTCIGMKKLPLLERRGEPTSMANLLKFRRDNTPGKLVDDLTRHQIQLDLRPSTIRRLFESAGAELELKDQLFNHDRVGVLGRDLGAAHFIVARKGRIRFMGHSDWISNYRQDAEPGVEEEDLPMMTHTLCSLPTKYDPNFRVEAMDTSGIPLRYEGLLNFAGLNYLKWASFRNNKFMNDWCLDRIYCNHGETLEYLDVSGCTGISLSGLSGVWRLANLKTLVVKNLSHIKDLEILCATLEDQIPGLICIGVDYEKKLIDMRKDAAELEQKHKEEVEALEANTVEIVPRIASSEQGGPNPQQTADSRSHGGNPFP